MDWIKVQVTLPRDPRILRLAGLMGCSRWEALGMAVEWFAWLDGVTTDGKTGLTAEQVDSLFMCHAKNVTECHTFCHAMEVIGWIGVDKHGEVFAVNYDKHNGDSAKKRVQATERKRKQREKERHAKSVTSVTPKSGLDKIREDNNNKDNTLSAYNTVCGGENVPQRRTGKALPEGADEVERFMAGQAVCGLRGDELKACAQGFWDDMEACGWTARNGAPLFDWHAAARKYLNTWQRKAVQGRQVQPTVYRSEQPKNYNL